MYQTEKHPWRLVIKVINVHITKAFFRHVLILADGLDYLKSPLRDLKFPACFSIRQAFRQATMTFEKWNWDLFPIFFSISTTANSSYQPFRLSPGNMWYLTTWSPSTPVRFFPRFVSCEIHKGDGSINNSHFNLHQYFSLGFT